MVSNKKLDRKEIKERPEKSDQPKKRKRQKSTEIMKTSKELIDDHWRHKTVFIETDAALSGELEKIGKFFSTFGSNCVSHS